MTNSRKFAQWLDVFIAFIVVAVPGWFTIGPGVSKLDNVQLNVLLVGWLLLTAGGLFLSYWLYSKKDESITISFQSQIHEDLSKIKTELEILNNNPIPK